ncbi:ATP-dependent helicase/nuclease subunit B [Enhydrobacter aerosaccus]|uniref:ATP-dependent helicase/nuclease subunit B n=1 Tax=Enhydrobacter aerosaccus TaxID=225324 RepID=A0A1T4SVG1_9HYPH|nr:double-strand break repair protein AddB [Enhydrobacter aerosaccus]SKA32183.1 ATP-dependent helicase/nuclease subunit B [Enhydrobacter aerosaccus]
MKGIFTIGMDRRFADELARGLLAEYGGDPLALADILILLPTRRSVRALSEAFLRAADGKATILPRLAPLGDIDDSEWAEAANEGAALDLPPAIDPAEREALLAELVLAFKDDQGQPVAQSAAQALLLARELGSLLDELAIEGVAFETLETLVEGNFASHWQRTLSFLSIVGKAWPQILSERGQIDAIARRTQSIRQQAARWRQHPPGTPVIAAGSTGSQPATRELLEVIAGLPQGAIVLPGLDREMDDESWGALEPTHPQFGLKQLLAAFAVDRRAVADWPGHPGDSARRQLIAELMRPAETSEHWSRPPAAALDHVTRADCATPHQEAMVIALALRETLETPTRTAALVTPDRDLARRVAAELRRWNVEIDDSAGQPLVHSPPATLLRAVIAAIDSDFAPIDLLALLKHPLASFGLPRADLLDATRRLDRKCLRGLKPAPGLTALRVRIEETAFGAESDRRRVNDLIDRIDSSTTDLVALMAATASPADLLEATIASVEKIAIADALWSGDAGEALADALARYRTAWQGRRMISGREWPALLTAMLAPEMLRPRYGRHPRLSIWGPLEARLQRADLLILGGLNEGSWPPSVETGPWINRPMRTALGLPQPERRVGLSAHDFASALAAERVLLTRAEREGGAPTVPSRWLARLDALFGYEADSNAPPPEYIQRGRYSYVAWAQGMDDPQDYRPWPRPEPRPPLEARPTRLSVSAVETWRRDPYGLYARRILGLKALDPLEADLGAADRGSALHDALDEFLKEHPSGLLPPDALARFEALGERHLGELMAAPAERAFWWPRFQRLARWFITEENKRRASGSRLLGSETDGALTIGPPSRPLRIEARADRIDQTGLGEWEIIDYKTGRVPSPKELDALFAPQLLLEAAMAEQGGFGAIRSKPKKVDLAYWQANGLGDGGAIKEIKDSAELIPAMLALIEKMAEHFAKPTTPYAALPWPEFGPYFNDYAHLERVAEWSTAGGSDE